MNLLALRTLFTTFSGRQDLVQTVGSNTYTNNGADFFIQAGQKLLESMIVTPKSKAKALRLLAQAGYSISLSNCQSVHEVWARQRTALTSGTMTTGYRYQIVAQSLLDFTSDGASASTVGVVFVATSETLTLTAADSVVRVDYDADEDGYRLNPVDRVALEAELVEDQSLANQGEPFYYSLDVVRDTFTTESDTTVRGIVMGPPADTYYTITVFGIFRFDELSSDSDTNYWTDEWSFLLLYASLYMLESFYRNSTGMKDWMNAIMVIITGVESDKVEEEIHDINQMRG